MTDETESLEPCPFCGGAAKFGQVEDDEDDINSGGQFIACTNPGCEASTNLRFACGEDPKPLLAEQWNRRSDATITALRTREAELVETLEQAREWLSGWASAEPYIEAINATLAGDTP